MLCVRYVLHALCSMRSMRDQARNEAAPWRQISTGEAQEEKDDDDKYDGRRKSRRNRSRMGGRWRREVSVSKPTARAT